MSAVQSPVRVSSTTKDSSAKTRGVQKHPTQVARRNARERNRVRQVNMGFVTLRNHIPNQAKNKKLSKVETLRQAAVYIEYLSQVLEHPNEAHGCPPPFPPMSETLSDLFSSFTPSSSSTPASMMGHYFPQGGYGGAENYNPESLGQNSPGNPFTPQFPGSPYVSAGSFPGIQTPSSVNASPAFPDPSHYPAQTFIPQCYPPTSFGQFPPASAGLDVTRCKTQGFPPSQISSNPSPSSSFVSETSSNELSMSPEQKYSQTTAFQSSY